MASTCRLVNSGVSKGKVGGFVALIFVFRFLFGAFCCDIFRALGCRYHVRAFLLPFGLYLDLFLFISFVTSYFSSHPISSFICNEFLDNLHVSSLVPLVVFMIHVFL